MSSFPHSTKADEALRSDPAPGRTALYRFYDADDQLLYVGITSNPKQRWKAHASGAAWWAQAVRKSVKWFDSRPEAAVAEAHAITAEVPAHNVVHNHERHARTQAEYDAVRADPRLLHMTAEEKVSFFTELGLHTDARYWQHVVDVVSQAPPLGPEQVSRLRVLIWGSDGPDSSP
ncbi:GIY-YIG nuclease family protein [Streptomyces sp. NPDC001027]|uniref:GIY-YIG nuclease family protein n=1 Tax=Streptomyces sp. NPDC001027 TaxID=3154771 RepID=UPI0033232F1C